METSNYNLSGTNHPSAHPIDNNQNQYVTYEFQKKFWGNGSEISFGNNAEEGDLVWDGSRFWKARFGDVGSFDPSNPSIHDWHVQAKAVQGSALEGTGVTNSQILGRFDSTNFYELNDIVSDSAMTSWYQMNGSGASIPLSDSSTFQATLDAGSAIGLNVGDIFWDTDQNEYRKVQIGNPGNPVAVPTSLPGVFVAPSATLADFIAAGHVVDVTGQVSLYEDLEDLANDGSTNVVVAAGDANAGAYYARIDQTTGAPSSIEYLADSLNVSVTSEGAAYSIDVDYVSGLTATEGKELTAQAIVDAINSATANGEIGSVVEAELVNTNEVKLTAKKSGTPFDTVITPANNHTDLTSGHDFPSGNTGGTTAAGADVDITKAVADPVTISGSSTSTDAPYSIYKPASNWGIQTWDATHPHQGGDLVWDTRDSSNPKIWEVGEQVKGYWNGGSVKSGEIFLHNNTWYQANQDTSDTPGETSNWSSVEPLLTASTDKTSEYMDLSNADLWTKTHYGNLVGDTIDQDYVRGDTFLHGGKHYIYVSAKGSSDYEFDPGQDGITEFELLKDAGTVMELPMYVDTIGRGGSSGLADGLYYRPNQELEFVDRLADSGLARTNSISRRGEPGVSDGIFNSRDDIYYGGLNPGNDGIYGTSDDTYTTTRYPHLAQAGGHVDSDADNNKDLLNESNNLTDFSISDFVDFIQTIANVRAVNGGTMSRLDYSSRMLDESIVNLEAAYGRIMDADIAMESSRFARHNVMVQASASMVAQANQLTNVALTLLGR